VAIAVENDPFSMDIRAGVIDDAKRWGMKVVIDDKLPKELTDMTATLTKVKALRPDALIVSGHSKGAALAVRQTAQMKVDVPMLAITHCEAADVIGKFGGDANYTLCATQWAETMTYKDQWFGFAGDYAKEPCWFMSMPCSAPIPLIPRRYGMRWPQPKSRPSMVGSTLMKQAKTSPSRWCCVRSRRANWYR
jgi:hypothetical protein